MQPLYIPPLPQSRSTANQPILQPTRDVRYYDDPLLQAYAYEQHITAYIKLLEYRQMKLAALAIRAKVESHRDGYERLAKETGAMIRKAYAWQTDVHLMGVWNGQLDWMMAMGGGV